VLGSSFDAVEVEALGVVTGLVRTALDALLPEPLDRVQVREDEQSEVVRQVLEGHCARTAGDVGQHDLDQADPERMLAPMRAQDAER
jgi:hypothetical protein